MSETTINFTLRDTNDNLIDADSTPVLRDEDDVFGVKRNDTNAVVVAAGTAMVRDSLGTYHYTFTDPVSGVVYTGAIEYVVGGETNWLEFEKAGSGSGQDVDDTEWYYADAQAVIDLLGSANLQISSDLEDDGGTTNWALVQRDGETADAYFNSILRGGAYVVPIKVSGVELPNSAETDETRRLFRDLSARYVATLLNEHRAIQAIGQARSQQDVDRWFASQRKIVIDMLKSIRDGDVELLADKSTADVDTSPGGFEFPPIASNRPCTDENEQ